jgi:ankyrin repeat protein
VSLPPPPISAATEALFAAIRGNNLVQFDRALASGADINGEEVYDFPIDRDWYQGSRTPLRLAVDLQNMELVRRLLAVRGVEVDRGDCFAGATPLMGAARKANREIVEILLAAGADPNCEEKYELCTAAGFAIRASCPEIAIRLIEVGTDLKRYGHRLFTEATNFNLTAVVDLIAARGISMRDVVPDKKRLKQLAMAARLSAASYEPSPSISDSELFRAAEEGDARLLRAAVAHGLQLNRRRAGGDTPLMVATRAGQSHAAIILIEGGADIRITNDKGEDAASLAEAFQRTFIAATLRRRARQSSHA